jgi:methanogenic corrinoid protein MtbC1
MEQVARVPEWQSAAPRDQKAPDAQTLAHDAGTGAGFTARNRRTALLTKIVEAEILPRLALARAAGRPKPAERSPVQVTTEDDTTELVRLLMDREDGGAWTFVQLLAERGATPSALYLGIIAAAARKLGELWEEDRCDFAQVTISLGRLQQVVRALSPSFQRSAVGQSAHADTVLLLPAPGEQHTLGLLILAEFFRREGWEVIGGPVSTGYDAVELVRGALVDVAGFSIGSIECLAGLAGCIRAIRKASRNRHLSVMVGGPLFLQRPELVTRVGADAAAADAPSAVRQASGLLAMRGAAD